MLDRRQFLAASAAAGLMAPFAAHAQSMPAVPAPAYPHLTLDAQSLPQYPDNRDSLDEILASAVFRDRFVIVELVTGWCSHCARQKPEMDAALASLATDGAQIARLTIYYEDAAYAGVYRNLVRQLSQSASFPETQIWQGGQSKGYFAGAFTADRIEQILHDNFPAMFPAPPGAVPAPAP